MRIDFFGLAFETPRVTVHLGSPWRATALEHRMFDAVRQLPRTQFDEGEDELIVHLTDPKSVRSAVQAAVRVLKGWQEEGDSSREKRSWWWLVEGDTNADGYDHTGEPFTLWAFLRIAIERGSLGEPEKGEDIDLHGFSLRIWGENGVGGN
ncbi:MAG: hypothetical protein JNM56_30995 [Planctomycetia bacterium]|nr:hypothetical protein [Planctomycetia bacterium]